MAAFYAGEKVPALLAGARQGLGAGPPKPHFMTPAAFGDLKADRDCRRGAGVV